MRSELVDLRQIGIRPGFVEFEVKLTDAGARFFAREERRAFLQKARASRGWDREMWRKLAREARAHEKRV